MTGFLQQTVAALASGGLVGFSLGLIGGGGSILATPLLLYVVGVRDVHTAIGTGALAVSVNAYLNLIGHAIKGHVWWRCALIFACSGALGAFFGSSLGKLVDGGQLLFGFGLLMIVVGVLMRKPLGVRAIHAGDLDGRGYWKMTVVALSAGICSGVFGIGGGFLIVPGLMLSAGMPIINAIGSSLLAVGTFGLTTAINYSASGLVDWPNAAKFIAGGVVGGVLGMLLSTRLASRRAILHRIFSTVILLVAAYILWRSLTD